MKVNITKKSIVNNYSKIVCVGYCDWSNLLVGKNANYYTCGVYGWNSDIYIIDNIAIVTGYRPFGNYELDYKLGQKLDNKAREILKNYDIPFEKRVQKIDKLLKKALENIKCIK